MGPVQERGKARALSCSGRSIGRGPLDVSCPSPGFLPAEATSAGTGCVATGREEERPSSRIKAPIPSRFRSAPFTAGFTVVKGNSFIRAGAMLIARFLK